MALVAARELDHEPKVGIDQPFLGGQVAALDPLREIDFLGRGEKRVLRGLVEEELKAVGGIDLVGEITPTTAAACGRALGSGVVTPDPMGICALLCSTPITCHVTPVVHLASVLQKV